MSFALLYRHPHDHVADLVVHRLEPSGPYAPFVNNVLIWLLFALLGWHVCGPLLHP